MHNRPLAYVLCLAFLIPLIGVPLSHSNDLRLWYLALVLEREIDQRHDELLRASQRQRAHEAESDRLEAEMVEAERRLRQVEKDRDYLVAELDRRDITLFTPSRGGGPRDEAPAPDDPIHWVDHHLPVAVARTLAEDYTAYAARQRSRIHSMKKVRLERHFAAEDLQLVRDRLVPELRRLEGSLEQLLVDAEITSIRERVDAQLADTSTLQDFHAALERLDELDRRTRSESNGLRDDWLRWDARHTVEMELATGSADATDDAHGPGPR